MSLLYFISFVHDITCSVIVETGPIQAGIESLSYAPSLFYLRCKYYGISGVQKG